MGRIAFLFSGQGDQHTGMGKQLYDSYPCAKEVFDLCDSVRENTSLQCFEASEEVLKETKNTQPCLFAMELAGAEVLKYEGIVPEAVAGFSLGEVVAATVSGIFDKEVGFRLVCKRGELMQEAATAQDASMVAVVKLNNEQVEELCKNFANVYPVNFNCPGQVTVSGLTEQIAEFSVAVKNAGGRALPLKVKGGFHSPFMNGAAASFYEEVAKAETHAPALPLYSNMTALPYTEAVAETLSKQICNPVRWEQTIRNLISEGFDTFIEVGPGKTLTNMMKKIAPEMRAYALCDLQTILQEVKGC